MIDINNTLDLIKLKFYNEWLYTAHFADEGESEFHKSLVKQMMAEYFDKLKLKKDASILEINSGAGYVLDELKSRKFFNFTGTTLSEKDQKLCTDKGHNVKIYDPTCLPQKDGYYDETIDMIICRHSLSKSPYPIFTLAEYNRILKQFGKLLIEVPAPECERRHEFQADNYSILTAVQWSALFERTGFKVERFNNIDFDLNFSQDGEDTTVKEKYYCILLTKQRPLDIK
jgi:cyclopropane fatty-acyl-phospholipid synthase-like methyltransferase